MPDWDPGQGRRILGSRQIPEKGDAIRMRRSSLLHAQKERRPAARRNGRVTGGSIRSRTGMRMRSLRMDQALQMAVVLIERMHHSACHAVAVRLVRHVVPGNPGCFRQFAVINGDAGASFDLGEEPH